MIGFISSNSKGNGHCTITQVTEDNFNIIPNGLRVWSGDIPWFTGDKFPTEDIIDRASAYKTYSLLYKNEYDEVFSRIYDIQSMIQDTFSYSQIYDLSLNIPEFRNCTESWVDLIASNPPMIDGETDDVERLSSFLSNSNFNEQFKSIIRNNIMYGNKIIKITKTSSGDVTLVDMRASNWIPFVDSEDYCHIGCNVFFNIVDTEGNGEYICEFVCYEESGNIRKKTFSYNKESGILGELIDDIEDVSFIGESPIVVFRENAIENGVIGTSAYPSWESSIASSIKAYSDLLTMLTRAKEAVLMIPNFAGETDEATDRRLLVKRGVIEYTPGIEHDVSWVTPSYELEKAIEVYKQTMNRLSRDTGLNLAFFDMKMAGVMDSAKSIKTLMFKTELRAQNKINEIEYPTKLMIHKIGLAHGLSVNIHDFNLMVKTGFINDEETRLKIVQARLGNKPTMGIVDAISSLDGISSKRAREKAYEIYNVKREKEGDIEIDERDGVVGDDLGFSIPKDTLGDTSSIASTNNSNITMYEI